MPQQQIAIDLNEESARKLFELPSAVTDTEKQLALYYASEQWDGKGDIFENGPLLGGATRALAMGMQHNEKRNPEALLHTYDWFSIREALDLPENVWEYLVQAKLLKSEEVTQAFERGTFQPLFKALHKKEEYWPLIRPHVGYLPGHRGDIPKYGEDVFEITDYEFSLAFIDGCKSWYGTKHWFRELVPHLRPGADILFQDFSHYTCFWIPMLVGMFREHFELKAFADYTYVWKANTVPTVEEVESIFPDEPTGVERETYDEVLDRFLREAVELGDRRSVLLTQMQKAAAYAYIGLLEESRDLLDKLLMQFEWMPFRPYLQQARISPTYTPEGKIEL